MRACLAEVVPPHGSLDATIRTATIPPVQNGNPHESTMFVIRGPLCCVRMSRCPALACMIPAVAGRPIAQLWSRFRRALPDRPLRSRTARPPYARLQKRGAGGTRASERYWVIETRGARAFTGLPLRSQSTGWSLRSARRSGRIIEQSRKLGRTSGAVGRHLCRESSGSPAIEYDRPPVRHRADPQTPLNADCCPSTQRGQLPAYGRFWCTENVSSGISPYAARMRLS